MKNEDFHKYENKIPYPKSPSKPILKHDATPNEIREYADKLEQYQNIEIPNHEIIIKKYHEEKARLMEQLKHDILEDIGILNHHKADILYNMAWERQHDNGFYSVYLEACELAELLQ